MGVVEPMVTEYSCNNVGLIMITEYSGNNVIMITEYSCNNVILITEYLWVSMFMGIMAVPITRWSLVSFSQTNKIHHYTIKSDDRIKLNFFHVI